MQRAVDDAAVAHVLDAIYDSAVAPERWADVLQGLAGLFDSHFADLFARDHARTRFQGLAFGLDAADYGDAFIGKWVKRNVWSKKRPVEVAGEVLSTRAMVPKDELLRSEIYNEYLHPRGLHEGMRLAIWSGDGWIQDISLLRSWSAGAFGETEIALGQVLLPHIQRAAGAARRLRTANLSAHAGFEALDILRYGALLVDGDGAVLQFNRVAERLLIVADGLRLADGRLTAARESDSRRLLAAVAAAAGRGGRRLGGTLILPRPSGRAALTVTIVPLREELMQEQAGWLILRQPAALALVSDPDSRAALAGATITAQFGLTDSERSLALDLLAGRNVAAIAARRGRSVHTVRTHLARLMGKTNTNRQSDLLRLLMSVSQTIDGGDGPLSGDRVVNS